MNESFITAHCANHISLANVNIKLKLRIETRLLFYNTYLPFRKPLKFISHKTAEKCNSWIKQNCYIYEHCFDGRMFKILINYLI